MRDRILASPSARRAAKELGVDLSRVVQANGGTGPGGRIVKSDVVAAAAALPEASPTRARVGPVVTPEDTVVPFDRMRRKIAERLTFSWQTIPHFYISVDVDMSEALAWRTEANRAGETKISVTDMIVGAAATALVEFPRMNAHVDGDRVVFKRHVNIGVAVALDDGLLVPVIPDADRKDLVEIAGLSRKNADAARRGSIDPNVAGTFTVSSLGMYGVREFVPVVNPPECAILAVGAIDRRVVPVTHGLGFRTRDLMTLTLACDHRAVDGAYAARFLDGIRRTLEGMHEC